MNNDDLERQAFLKFKAVKENLEEDTYKSDKAKRDAENKRKARKAKKLKERSKIQPKGALNSDSMFLQLEESQIYNLHTEKFRERVLRVKHVVEIEDEAIIHAIGYVMIRLYRKAKLESVYGRFMDRTAPQDPVTQLATLIKQLGIKNDVKGNESSKEMIGKLLSGESDSSSSGSTMPSLEEWRKQQISQGIPSIKFRSEEEFLDVEITDDEENEGSNEPRLV